MATDGGLVAVSTATIMFTGHSLTDNPLPDDVVAIAVSLGLSGQYQQQNIVGSPLRSRTVGHGNDPFQPAQFPWTGYSSGKNRSGMGMNLVTELRVPSSITATQYTALVVAENHNSLDMLRWESTVKHLRHYYELFHEGSPQGRGYFYGTWLGVTNKANPASWVALERAQLTLWESITARLNDSLRASGRTDLLRTLPANGALAELVERSTSPAGLAGVTQANTTATLNGIFSDDVHLTRLGVYYMACVVFASVYGRSPVGASVPSGVSAAAGASLQSLAWSYVSAYYAANVLGPQPTTAARLTIGDTFPTTYFTYRNNPGQIAGYRTLLTTTNLTNPLWWAAGTNEAGFWFPRLP
ncbi:MAG: hypothetical protein Q8N26_01315 [Myxococcales bacterium]|nr:hypothetical protein [Myxococcales bacterium]